MKITIAVNDHEFSLEVTKQNSVLNIKHKIKQILGASVESQTLSVLGWELIDGLDMEDYPIVAEGTKINLDFLKMYEKIPLIIKLASKKIKIDVEITDTIRSLKEKIHILDGTPLKRMMLYFCGQELDQEFCSLAEYGIKEFSEIYVYFGSFNYSKVDCKRLSVVVQTSRALLNSARFTLDVNDSSVIGELRRILLCSEILPYDDYIFIHKQRVMREERSFKWHEVENGDFIYVFKGSVGHEK